MTADNQHLYHSENIDEHHGEQFPFETEEPLEIQDHRSEDPALPYWVWCPNANMYLAKCADRLVAQAIIQFIDGDDEEDEAPPIVYPSLCPKCNQAECICDLIEED